MEVFNAVSQHQVHNNGPAIGGFVVVLVVALILLSGGNKR
jgi:hypothetical protein